MKEEPKDLEAEQAVLGACLLNPKAIFKAQKILDPNDFYRNLHQVVFQAVCELGKDLDAVTLNEKLADNEIYKKAGGKKYIFSLSQSVATSAGIVHHAEIVKEKSTRRKMIQKSNLIIDHTNDPVMTVDELLSLDKQVLREIEFNRTIEEISTEQLINGRFNALDERYHRKSKYNGILTGFNNIDRLLKGAPTKKSYYLIARPSIGKTALALNIADNVAERYPEEHVLFFEHESDSESLVDRCIVARSGVNYLSYQAGDLENEDYKRIINIMPNIPAKNIHFFEHSKYKLIDNLKSRCESFAIDKKISWVIIDHIQLMRSANKNLSRNDLMGEISEKLQEIAKELNTRVLILCQLNRNAEGIHPTLDHMRDSGNLEQNADIVWGLYRQTREDTVARLEQLKGRDKGTWVTELYFDRFTQKYQDLKKDDDTERNWYQND